MTEIYISFSETNLKNIWCFVIRIALVSLKTIELFVICYFIFWEIPLLWYVHIKCDKILNPQGIATQYEFYFEIYLL